MAVLRKLGMTEWLNRVTARVLQSLRSWVTRIRQWDGWKNSRFWACGISLLLHLSFAVWAARSLWLESGRAREVVLSTAWASDEALDFGDSIAIEIAEVLPQADVGGGSAAEWLNPLAAQASVEPPQPELLAASGAASGVNAAGESGIRPGRGEGAGIGNGRGNGSGNGKQFFGRGVEAKSVVYVLDCSMSMNHPHESDAKTRFNRIKQELTNSINSLKPDQEFFIVFFNHNAIPMPADGLVTAVAGNPRRYLDWMEEVPATGDTDPTSALQIAMRLRPDVIYFLTDGCFSPAANDIVKDIRQNRTVIHTFNFEPKLTAKQREGLELFRQKKPSRALVKLGEGTFRRVREHFVAEQVMQQLAQQNGGKYHVIP